MLRLLFILILLISVSTGCISTTEPPAAFTAQVENEITDQSVLQQVKDKVTQSRVDFQQDQLSTSSQQQNVNQYSQQLYNPGGYTPNQFVPASAPPKPIQNQNQTESIVNTGFEVPAISEDLVKKNSYSSLSNIRVVGTIAVSGGDKALIQRDGEDSFLASIGEELMHDGQLYSIRKITNSGEVIVSSENEQYFSIR
jgi:hypothetical protein